MDGVTLPLKEAISRIKAKSDEFRVSTVTTTILLIERSAPIPVCLYTYSSSNLEEAHLQKHSTANLRLLIPTEEDLARTKCTYRGDTVRIKLSYRHERLHEWSALKKKTLYDWITLTATNICTSEVHLWRWHSTIEGHWGWEAFPRLKRTYSGGTLRSVKCIYGYRPTQFRRPTMTTTTTTVTDYLRAQALLTIEAATDKWSANDPSTLSSKKRKLAAQAVMATLDENAQSISLRQT